MAEQWWRTFFDEGYLQLWQASLPASRSETEAAGLWRLLRLEPNSRVLDAPCGWGRVSSVLARRGAVVLGVDQSPAQIEHAEGARAGIPAAQLQYLIHDLREPLTQTGFDAAYNIFSSIGYGTEDGDLAVFRTLRAAVRPAGYVFVETMHRDLAVTIFARGASLSTRLADGTLVVEEPVFDPIGGRVETSWHWWGPRGRGVKSASLRTYCATELLDLLKRAGLVFVSAHQGCSPEPFTAGGPDAGGRLGLLMQRPAE